MQNKTGGNTIISLYLTTYNTLQTILWTYIIYLSCASYLNNNNNGQQQQQTTFWKVVSPYVLLAVGLSWMESMHAMLGLVKGTPASSAIQSFGRSHALLIPYAFTLAQENYISLLLLYIVWGLSEIIRYPWYTLTSLNMCPYYLTWLRYSAFIVLYPIGIISELSGYWAAWPQINTFTGYDIQLSSIIGETYNHHYDLTLFRFRYWVIFGIIILYPLAGPYLYMYMLKQRNKKLKLKVM